MGAHWPRPNFGTTPGGITTACDVLVVPVWFTVLTGAIYGVLKPPGVNPSKYSRSTVTCVFFVTCQRNEGYRAVLRIFSLSRQLSPVRWTAFRRYAMSVPSIGPIASTVPRMKEREPIVTEAVPDSFICGFLVMKLT